MPSCISMVAIAIFGPILFLALAQMMGVLGAVIIAAVLILAIVIGMVEEADKDNKRR